MRKVVGALMCLGLLSGCSAHTEGWVIEGSVIVCSEHRGVDSIDHINNWITCNDGRVLTLGELREALEP